MLLRTATQVFGLHLGGSKHCLELWKAAVAVPIEECPRILFLARGFRDQNAGLGAGWLVAAGGLKKKKDFINFLPDKVFLSTNDNYISSIY
jgi:hypothetical protein